MELRGARLNRTRPAILLAAVLLLTLLTVGAAAGAAAAAEPPAAPVSPQLTVVAAPDHVLAAGATTVTAHLDVPGATLVLSRWIAGTEGFVPLATVVAGPDGSCSQTFRPSRTSTYRVEFAGDATWAAAAAEVAVTVRPRLRLVASETLAYEGQNLTLEARVRPAHPGAVVVAQRFADGAWTHLRTLTLDDASRAVFRWRADELGKHQFRLVMAADAAHEEGVGEPASITVEKGNRWGAPLGAPRFIVVDKSEYRLYYLEYGRVVRSFVCVLGKPSTPTPLGRFRIYAMDGNMYGPYGPRRMRYLGAYAIHGTNEPWLLTHWPRAYSHGCTRLANANILWLFARCSEGTPVWNVR